jgi:hypothetical protein
VQYLGHHAGERDSGADLVIGGLAHTALYPSAASSAITLDFPVPDMPVSRTRFTVVSLRPRRRPLSGPRGQTRAACEAPSRSSSYAREHDRPARLASAP